MNLLKITLSSAVLIFTCTSHSTTLYKSDESMFAIGGFVRMHVISKEDIDTQLVNNNSRINFSGSHQLQSGWSAFALMEWEVNIMASENVHGLSKDGYLDIDDGRDDLFINRKGYAGFEHDTYGKYTMGKTYGTYYDIAGQTDIFYTGGGNASGAFDFGDGGVSGTGRSDSTLLWQNDFAFDLGTLDTGIQYQLTSNEIPVNTYDGLEGTINSAGGLGLALKFDFNNGLVIGGAYSNTELTSNDLTDSTGENVSLDESYSSILGMEYQRNHWTLATNYSWSKGRKQDNLGNIVAASGTEAVVIYDFTPTEPGLRVYGGFNYVSPSSDALDQEKPYKLSQWYLAADYAFSKLVKVYLEVQYDNGKDITFDDETGVYGSADSKDNYAALGFKFYW